MCTVTEVDASFYVTQNVVWSDFAPKKWNYPLIKNKGHDPPSPQWLHINSNWVFLIVSHMLECMHKDSNKNRNTHGIKQNTISRKKKSLFYWNNLKGELRVCLQILGSTTTYVQKKKSCIKPFEALVGAAWNMINCLKWFHLSQRRLGPKTTRLKMKKPQGVELERSEPTSVTRSSSLLEARGYFRCH